MLAEPGSEERWHQLQRLRRGGGLEPWIAALASGALPPAPDLLASLWGRLDAAAVARLLGSAAAADPAPWLTAAQLELPLMAADPQRRQAWLEPLLRCQAAAPPSQALVWLQLLGQLRDPRVAGLLRQVLTPRVAGAWPAAPDTSAPEASTPSGAALPPGGALPPLEAAVPLLPLLGLQRDPQDGDLLLQLALRPGPLALRRAALEGLAVGLSAWPAGPLVAGLSALVTDLDPGLAQTAVDLLSRLPGGQAPLRRLLGRRLDPAVRSRLRRRVRATPLVLLVHGRQGGLIPAELRALAAELADRRGAPVLLQALTAAAPEPDGAFWAAARRSEGVSLVPLLLLPGGHVRRDLPAIAADWRTRAESGGVPLRRLPFLGAWPAWQRGLAQHLGDAATAAGLPPRWLHHPLEGPLAARYLAHLAAVLGCPGAATPYSAHPGDLACCSQGEALLLPLTLAANRLSESLTMGASAPIQVLPPLLEMPALRQLLIAALESLP